MKKRPVLSTAIAISLFLEIILIIFVYTNIGSERLPVQMGRLLVQVLLMIWIITNASNTALFLLTAYHILSGLFIIYSNNSTAMYGILLIGYHFGIGLLIYFHDWIENNMGISSNSEESDS